MLRNSSKRVIRLFKLKPLFRPQLNRISARFSTSNLHHQSAASSASTSMGFANLVEIDGYNFQRMVMSPDPLFLYCYSAQDCKSMQILSDMNQLAHKVKDKCAFGILNVDNNIKIAQMIGINEVPILLAIKQGQGISSFPGYIDRNAVVQFVDQLKLGFTLGSESDAFEAVLNQGKLLEDEEDITGAAKVYSQILSAQAKFEDLPKFKARAYGGLARLALKEENVESAEEIVNLLKSDYPDYISVPDVASAFFGLAIYEEKKNSPFKTIEQARAELEQNPKSLEAEYFLGVLLLSSGAYEDGIEQILKVVKKDRRWNDEAPKKLLMQVFSALGNSHPVTIKGRRRLANYLF